MKTIERYLSCAETAKMVRNVLKAKWPKIKFSVRSKTYSGGASITVRYTNGPIAKEVENTVNLYEGADFDGMQDLKTYKDTILTDEKGNMERVHMGADFIHVERDYTPEYNWFLCNKIDLQNDKRPSLKEQFHNLWSAQHGYPYLNSSMSISKDEKICRIYTTGEIFCAECVAESLRLQGYIVSQYIEEGKNVFEAKDNS